MPCRHTDVREFDGLRSCLSCGETRSLGNSLQEKAATQEQSYIYTDLRCLEWEQNIRLVVLEPGDYESPIHCTLIFAGLRFSEYEAVSYTWATEDGDDTKSQRVYIDGSVFFVTKNCEAALRCLREHGSRRRFWIDAMCINQENTRERNHQVGLMDLIYREAIQVHVYIEQRDRSTAEVMQWLASDDVHNAPRGPVVEQMKVLFQCRYFGRLWVIQEMALAKGITLHVNSAKATLTHDAISRLGQVCLRNRINIPGPIRMCISTAPYQSLKPLLRTSLSSSCSNPRDKIYGILSLLAPDIRLLITVNYSLSPEQVFAEAILAFITTYHDLGMLKHAHLPQYYEDLGNVSCFTVDSLCRYMHSPRVSSAYEYTRPKFWTRHVHLLLPNKTFDCSSIGGSKGSQSTPIQRVDTPMPTSQVLPCLRVVAHQIDTCLTANGYGVELFDKCVKGRKFQGVLKSSRAKIRRKGVKGDQLEGLASRMAVINLESPGVPTESDNPNNRTTKCTHGILLSSRFITSQPGDVVFRINGIREHAILRPLTGPRFRIVGAGWWEDICAARFWEKILRDPSNWDKFLPEMKDCPHQHIGERQVIEIY